MGLRRCLSWHIRGATATIEFLLKLLSHNRVTKQAPHFAFRYRVTVTRATMSLSTFGASDIRNTAAPMPITSSPMKSATARRPVGEQALIAIDGAIGSAIAAAVASVEGRSSCS